jgi:hypothetical protein
MLRVKRWPIALIVPVVVLGAMVPAITAGGSSKSVASLIGSLVRTANVLPGLSQATSHGPTAGSTRLTVDIGLGADTQAAETEVLNALYSPSSPQYHKFLTPPSRGCARGDSPSRTSRAPVT